VPAGMLVKVPPVKLRWLSKVALGASVQFVPKQPSVVPEKSTTVTARAGAEARTATATNPTIFKIFILPPKIK
jgi:hypothetical protein